MAQGKEICTQKEKSVTNNIKMVLNQRMSINHLCTNTYPSSRHGDLRSVSLDTANDIVLDKVALVIMSPVIERGHERQIGSTIWRWS